MGLLSFKSLLSKKSKVFHFSKKQTLESWRKLFLSSQEFWRKNGKDRNWFVNNNHLLSDGEKTLLSVSHSIFFLNLKIVVLKISVIGFLGN